MTVLLLFLLAGEGLVRLCQVTVPGSIVGMLLLLVALQTPWGPRVEALILGPGGGLLAIMPLLLVPLAVGLITEMSFLADDGLPALIAMVAGWLVATAVSAAVSVVAMRRTRT
jgi:holin-like protein